jgi:hypothetical protein
MVWEAIIIFFSLMPNDQRGWLPLFNQHLHLSRFSFSLQPGWLFLTVLLISYGALLMTRHKKLIKLDNV